MKYLTKNVLTILFVFFAIAAFFSILASSIEKPEEISLSKLADEVKQGQVKEIEVEADSALKITTTDDKKQLSRKEHDAKITEILVTFGVTPEQIQTVNIKVSKESGFAFWLGVLLPFILPVLIIGGFLWFMLRSAQRGSMQALTFAKARAKLFGPQGKKQDVTFKDVANAKEAKEELLEIVDFLKNPKKFLNMGAKIPKGVLLMGAPGTGKCITGDSLIPTNKGLVRIADIPKYFAVRKNGEVLGAKIYSANLEKLERIHSLASHWYDIGVQKTIRVESEVGHAIEGTPEHPVVVLDKPTGNFAFKKLQDLHENDILLMNYNHQAFGSYTRIPDEETAYALGLLIGDGNLTIKNRIVFTAKEGQTVDFLRAFFLKRFRYEIKKAQAPYDYFISSQKIKRVFLEEYGLGNYVSENKEVPEWVRIGIKSHVQAFLRGLFDTDGYCDSRTSYIQFSTSSHALAKQVSGLLLNLGIMHRAHSRKKNVNNKLQFYLEISGDFTEIFAKEIGFALEYKKARLEAILRKKRNTNRNVVFYQEKRLERFIERARNYNVPLFNGIPVTRYKNIRRYIQGIRNPSKHALQTVLTHYSTLAPRLRQSEEYQYLKNLSDNHFFLTKIKKVSGGRARVYDFTVPNHHSFVANGFVNHNTLLARAVSGEAGVPFFSISGSEFVEMFVGVGAARVRDLFETAKKTAPAIIFIDEIDAVGRLRGSGLGGGHDEREQTLNQILSEMDGFEQGTNVIVMAATNRPDVLDPALLRPGRFDRRVVIDTPDVAAREEILNIHAKGKPLAKNVDLKVVASRTPGFSGAELANLMNEAAILAARKEQKTISQNDILLSIEKVMLGPERRSHVYTEKEKKITAYHEAGHALVAHVLPNTDPVHKISIVSRGRAAGYTLKLPAEDKHFRSKTEFIEELAVMLGGYAAERTVFDELTTGASNDLQNASDLARKMVTEYGMSDKLGPVTFGEHEEMVFLGRDIGHRRNYSETIAAQIDQEVTKLISNALKTATKIVRDEKERLERLAQYLLRKETIERKDFEKLMSLPSPEAKPA